MARITCPECNLARINGVLCHETGCPNSKARYDLESQEWIKQYTCFHCGYPVDDGEICSCQEVYGDEY